MRKKNDRIIVVLPAYNAARTLKWTLERIPKDVVSKIVLVDDHSDDQTAALAKKLGLFVVELPHNVGYGGNQKICYLEAIKLGADIVVMLHPDGQYDPKAVGKLVKRVKEGADMVLGSRFIPKENALKGGMPLYKYISNRFLTSLENLIFGLNLSELHTGYRAYSIRFLKTVPFLRNSNDFVFDSEIIAQAVFFGFKINEVPVWSRYFEEASSVNLKTSIIYGLKTLGVLMKYILQKTRLVNFSIFQR